MESTSKKPIVGCYVIGGDSIYLSEEDIPNDLYCASEDYVRYFQRACEKLPEKLDCLVIVDHLLNSPETLQVIYEHAQDHSHTVHIIPAVTAILQRAATHTGIIAEERLLMLINIGKKYLSYVIEKNGQFLSPVEVRMNSLKSLIQEYSENFSSEPVFCIIGEEMEESIREQLGIEFTHIKIYHFRHQMKSLVVGGFSKARCIVEPGKNLEVANISPGIFCGSTTLVDPCSKFPLKLYFVPSSNDTMEVGETVILRVRVDRIKVDARWSFKKVYFKKEDYDPSFMYLLEYNTNGLMKIEKADINPFDIFDNLSVDKQKIQIWSAETERMGCFNFEKNFIKFAPLTSDLKNFLAGDLLSNEKQLLQHLADDNSDLLTVFVDHKSQSYRNGPVISVAPEYIGLLQYCLTFFGPSQSKLIFLLVTKSMSKFFVLNRKSQLCYTVTYCANISNYVDRSILCGAENAGLFYITEKGTKKFLFIEKEFKGEFIQTEIENCNDALMYGGAIYALQNSYKFLETPYVTVNPLLDPEDNNCDGLNTVSRKTSTCFYEIEAFFHGALKSINSCLFWGDTIAILLKRNRLIYIYFFVHVNGKFLFKFDNTISAAQLIDHALLHFADVVIVENFQPLNFNLEIFPSFFSWPVDFTVEQFLDDLKGDALVIYDTLPYAETVTKALDRKLYQHSVYQKSVMIIEVSERGCRIIAGKDTYLTVSGAEYIPMYLSFVSSPYRVGNDAVADLEHFPEYVIYDFLKLLGSTSNTYPFSMHDFDLVEMDTSDNPKLGYKVCTTKGYQIFPPEMALKIYLKKLIQIFENYTKKNAEEINFRLMDKIITEGQKEMIHNIGKQLEKEISFSNYY